MPEDFAKNQVVVVPKPKQKKTREQELTDRVKNLEKFGARKRRTRSDGQVGA